MLYNANEPLKSEINTLKKEKNALKQEINNLKQKAKQKTKNKENNAILLQKHKKVLDELKQLKNNSNRFKIQKDPNRKKLTTVAWLVQLRRTTKSSSSSSSSIAQ